MDQYEWGLGRELQLALYHQVQRIAPHLQTDYSGDILRQGDTVAFPDPNRYTEVRLCADRVTHVRGRDMRELTHRAMVEIKPAVEFMSGAKRFALVVLDVPKASDPATHGWQYAAKIVWGAS